MMDIKEVLCQWFINSLIKSSSSGIEKMRIFQTKSQLKIYTNQLLENSRKEKYTYLIDKFWGADLADMQLISKYAINK